MRKSPAIAFDNIAIAVTDLQRSADWYKRIFGFEIRYRTFIDPLKAEFMILRRQDMQIELLAQQSAARSAEMIPGPHLQTSGIKAIVFRTNDLEAVTAYLEDEVVDFVWKIATLSKDGLRSTMIRDPDGNLINVLSYPEKSLVF